MFTKTYNNCISLVPNSSHPRVANHPFSGAKILLVSRRVGSDHFQPFSSPPYPGQFTTRIPQVLSLNFWMAFWGTLPEKTHQHIKGKFPTGIECWFAQRCTRKHELTQCPEWLQKYFNIPVSLFIYGNLALWFFNHPFFKHELCFWKPLNGHGFSLFWGNSQPELPNLQYSTPSTLERHPFPDEKPLTKAS